MQTCYVLQNLEPDQHTRIIRADFHQSDERFVDLSRGKQSLTISFIALCFFKTKENVSTWKTADINDILNYGDIQYHASYKKMKIDGKMPQRKYLLINEVYQYAKICNQFFRLESVYVYGHLSAENDILSSSNLEAAINRFFKKNNNECGIFTCNIYSFAIIQTSRSFFLLNSGATSYAGELLRIDDKESAACLMEMFTIKCLVNHLLDMCNEENMIFDEADNRSQINFALMYLNIEKINFGKDILTRKKVDRHLHLAAINRGGIRRKYVPTTCNEKMPNAELVRRRFVICSTTFNQLIICIAILD